MTNERGWIYFVLAAGTERVKIGKSKNIERRLNGMKTDNPGELVPLLILETADIDGLEQAIHTEMAPSRDKGGWFKLTDELVGFMMFAREHGSDKVLRELMKPKVNRGFFDWVEFV